MLCFCGLAGLRVFEPIAKSQCNSSDSRDMLYVLVASAGEIHDHDVTLLHGWRELRDVRDSVRAFQRRHNPFFPRKQIESRKRVIIGRRGVLCETLIPQITVFGPYGRIIQSGRHGMSQIDLSVVVLEEISHRALENTGFSTRKTSSMLPAGNAESTGLDAYHLYFVVVPKGVKQAHRVASASDTGYKAVR